MKAEQFDNYISTINLIVNEERLDPSLLSLGVENLPYSELKEYCETLEDNKDSYKINVGIMPAVYRGLWRSTPMVVVYFGVLALVPELTAAFFILMVAGFIGLVYRGVYEYNETQRPYRLALRAYTIELDRRRYN